MKYLLYIHYPLSSLSAYHVYYIFLHQSALTALTKCSFLKQAPDGQEYSILVEKDAALMSEAGNGMANVEGSHLVEVAFGQDKLMSESFCSTLTLKHKFVKVLCLIHV